jgi:hypothetical protein
MEGRSYVRRGYGRRVGADERLITVTEARKVLPTVNGKRAGICRPVTSGQRQRALAEADRILEEAGI